MPQKKSYRVEEIGSIDEVPDWQRREPKWDELAELVLQLKPGQQLPVVFDSVKEAANARNAVRDTANEALGQALIRTRLVKLKDGRARTHFIRVGATTDAGEENTEEDEG